MKRKDFIGKAVVAGTTGIMFSTLDSCSKQNAGPNADFTIDISQSPYNILLTNGGVFRKDGVIMVRDNSGNITALAEACTHEGCSINYDSGTQTFPCPCHGARFNLNGGVMNGPAHTSLKKYTCTLTGTSLHVTG